jgi:hypothetical protein
MGQISFQGEAPFHMPTTQPPSVCGENGTVEVIVFASVQGKRPNDVPVRFSMSADQARMLISALVRAVREAEASDALACGAHSRAREPAPQLSDPR